MRIQTVIHLVGQLLFVFALIMIVPFIYSIWMERPYYSFLGTSIVCAMLAALLYYGGKETTSFSLRDGFLVVTLTWISASFFASIPFYMSGILPHYEDALFEAVSGITATGASVIIDVDGIPKTFVLWRGLTHWLGGMGIIVLLLAFLKNLGADSAHFFNAEASVPRPGVILPRIRSMATNLWTIYLFFTVLCALLLWGAGMTSFDAINMAFSTVSTGGFTPNSAGTFAYRDNYAVLSILIVFMILAGGNFTVYYSALTKGIRAIYDDYEYRMYLYILAIGSALVFLSLFLEHREHSGAALLDSVFMLVSMQTGSGFATAIYDQWPQMAQMVLFLATFFGGCSGSTTGGIKIIRFIILIKNSAIYLRKAIHPDMVQSIKINGKPLPIKWVQMAEQYFFLYLFIFAIRLFIIFITAMGKYFVKVNRYITTIVLHFFPIPLC